MSLISKILDYILNELILFVWDSLWFWRIFSLVILILLLVIFKYKNKILNKRKFIEHDRKLFFDSDNIINEKELSEFLTKIEFRFIERDPEQFFFSEYLSFFDQVSNKYLNPRIQQSLVNLYNNFHTLNNFITDHFMDYQGEQTGRLYFEPDLKNKYSKIHDYDKYYDDMILVINSTSNAYKDYRIMIKQKLFI